jgi:hypothetical protein
VKDHEPCNDIFFADHMPLVRYGCAERPRSSGCCCVHPITEYLYSSIHVQSVCMEQACSSIRVTLAAEEVPCILCCCQTTIQTKPERVGTASRCSSWLHAAPTHLTLVLVVRACSMYRAYGNLSGEWGHVALSALPV